MNDRLTLLTPASFWGAQWRDALPAGNGMIGVSVYGGVHRERILLNHGNLWWGSRTPAIPDVSDLLPEVRRLLLADRAREADRVLANAFQERGYRPELGSPLPLGDLLIVQPGQHGFQNYRRELDMAGGEITIGWRDGDTRFTRAIFVSRIEELVVCELRSSGPQPVRAAVTLDLHDRSDVRKPFDWPPAPLPTGLEVHAEHDCIFYAAAGDEGQGDFGAVARIVAADGLVEARGATLQVQASRSVLIFLKVFVNEARQTAWARLAQELHVIQAGYADLFTSHAVEHRRLFESVRLSLGDSQTHRSNEALLLEAYAGEASLELVEKMWAYGRYLLISSSRPGGNPCPLLGLWGGEYQGFWAFNMVNVNMQMIYWQALSGNMPEIALPLFDYHDRLLNDYRLNALRIYGCRGIFLPAPTAPDSGLLKTISPHIIHWTGGGGWIAQHYYDYYLYTGDEEFLRKRALPFMREVASFYQDFWFLGEDGYWISCPSNSPENTPGNYSQRYEQPGDEFLGETIMETTINATMDFAIAREVLINLISGARLTGMYAEEIPNFEQLLQHIPPYQVNEDGAVKEWMHPFFTDNYHHRHQSHLYPVFPGTEVTPESDPQLFEAFVTAVKKRLVIGLKEQSGWGLAYMANNYARMGEADLALECLDLISRSCLLNNFFTTHNDWRDMGICVDLPWAPFQIDANMGWTAAVQEMLCFSQPGWIKLLPALPRKWKHGSLEGLLCRGGVRLDLAWDQQTGKIEAQLLADRAQEVRVQAPGVIHSARINGIEWNSRTGSLLQNIHLEARKPCRIEIICSLYPIAVMGGNLTD